MSTSGILYLVSTPIGNLDDITFRAVKTLQQADIVVCEERKVGSKLLKQLDIQKPLTCLNEHNESDEGSSVIQQLKEGKSIALISDCGTPVFADPGQFLVQLAVKANIPIIPVPGASSLMTALVASNQPLDSFFYVGFLPRKREDRLNALQNLLSVQTTLVIYEAPYRLLPLLEDCCSVFGAQTDATLGTRLTQENEKFYRKTLKDLRDHFSQNPEKCEFVLMINNRRHVSTSPKSLSSHHITPKRPTPYKKRKSRFPKKK